MGSCTQHSRLSSAVKCGSKSTIYFVVNQPAFIFILLLLRIKDDVAVDPLARVCDAWLTYSLQLWNDPCSFLSWNKNEPKNSRRYSLEKKRRKALKENKLAALKQDFLSSRAFPCFFIPRRNTSQHNFSKSVALNNNR